jgi:hypothetical protein
MKNSIKLISFSLFLGTLIFAQFIHEKNKIINIITVEYFLKDTFYSSKKKVDLNISIAQESDSTVSIVKSSDKRIIDDMLEITFKVDVTVNKNIEDLIISDKIATGFTYQDDSLMLNGIAPDKFIILDDAVSITIGDAKEGEIFNMTYIIKVKV